VSYLGQFVRRARHTSSLAYDVADVVRARAESGRTDVAERPFQRCTVEIEIGVYIEGAER
jgi:hypothetical protein